MVLSHGCDGFSRSAFMAAINFGTDYLCAKMDLRMWAVPEEV
ncbi:hypothetical protein JOD43_001814 [Pullulanibacillus pueri]|nr:hypothetical protein [Pullulanibacillus pueri]